MVVQRTRLATTYPDRELSEEKHIRSLFIVALPRSLSTVAYHVSRLALGLDEPVWTSDGEILNNDRFSLYGGPTDDSGVKYVNPSVEPESFQAVIAFLNDVARREGRAYKDVVQPFAVSAWLPASGLRVLRLRRPVADVASAMRLRHWIYPARAAAADFHRRSLAELEVSIIDGLLRAEQALETLPGEVVDYDSLIEDEGVLREALQRLYPGTRVRKFRYIDDAFRRMRDTVLARREEDTFKELENLVRHRQIKLAAYSPASSPASRGLQTETHFTPG